MPEPASKKVCLVVGVGVGDGVGTAVARSFALGGFETAITRRARHLLALDAQARRHRAEPCPPAPPAALGLDARAEPAALERDLVNAGGG